MKTKIFVSAIALSLLLSGMLIAVGGEATEIEESFDESIEENELQSAQQIYNWTGLDGIRDNLDGDYILMNDLNETTDGYEELVNTTEGWDPIGEEYDEFTGTFDGNGYEIHDLYINRPETDNVGLFGALKDGAEVTNVGIVDTNVTGSSYAGGLIGSNGWLHYSGGTVSESYVTGNVSGDSNVGGLVGRNVEGTVSRSYAAGNVSGDSSEGGLVGYNNNGEASASFYHEDMPQCDVEGYGSLPLNDSEFNSISTFETAGWDIEAVDTERDYPFFSSSWEGYGGNSTWLIQESEKTYNLTVEIEGIGSTDPSGGNYAYSEHGKIVIEAFSEKESFFRNWTGDVESEDKIINLTMDSNKTITANFEDIDYAISDWEELHNMRQDLQGNYTLVNDLNETTYGYDEYVDTEEGWEPIGDYDYNDDVEFTGTFDGNGHEISDLYINRPGTDYVGLFGYIEDGEYETVVENVGLVDINVTGSGDVGGLIGWSEGSVSNIHSTGSVTGNDYEVGGLIGGNTGDVNNSSSIGNVTGSSYGVGGLIGWNYEGNVSNSSSVGNVTGSGSEVGGLIGGNDDDVDNSSSTGNVTGNGDYVGGLIGWSEGSVSNSHSDGTVEGTDYYVGGLIGYLEVDNSVSDSSSISDVTGNEEVGGLIGWSEGSVSNSHSISDVTGSGDYEIGGLIGGNSGDVSNSSSNGDVIGNKTGSYGVGGLIGWNYEGDVSDSSSIGNVTGNGSEVGGLIGGNDDDVDNSSSTGNVTGNGDYVGGLIGSSYGDVVDSYASGKVIGYTSQVGGLVGWSQGTVKRSYSTADVNGYNGQAGGLIGFNDEGLVNNSYASGTVTGDDWGIGGLVGFNQGNLEKSYANGNVSGPEQVGGLVGYNEGDFVKNSYATGNISGGSKTGGLIGYNSVGRDDNSTVSDSYATGDVSGDEGVGGLVGQNERSDYYNTVGIVESSYATGNITGNIEVGGLVGMNGDPDSEDYQGGIVESSYAIGDVNGTAEENTTVGGLVGENDGLVNQSYATGNVSGESYLGGLVGNNTGTVENSFWDVETSGIYQSDGGTGKTTTEMKDVSTFTNTSTEGLTDPWDFVGNPYDDEADEDLWDIDEDEDINQGYPALHWQKVDRFEFEIIDDQTAGESFEIEITAYNQNDNLAAGYTGTADLTDTTGTIDPVKTGEFTDGTWIGQVTITGADTNGVITAEDGDTTGESEEFEVEPAEADYIEISPEETSITAGKSQTYTAIAYDEYGNEWDVTEETTWSDNVEENSSWIDNVITVTESGEWTIMGEYDNETETLSATTTLTVNHSEAISIIVTPEEETIIAGESQSYTATAYDEYGNEWDVTVETTWSDDIDDSEWIDNEVTAYTAGTWTVTGEYENETGVTLTNTSTLNVDTADADYIVIEPEDSTITAGETIDFDATAYDEYDNVVEDDDAAFDWQNTNETGLFDETEAGDYDVTATYDTVTSAITVVTVEPSDVDEVVITPDTDQTIRVEDTIDFEAEAYDEYGNMITDDDIDFTWENTDYAGLFNETEAGEYEVTATYEGVTSEPTTVTVEAPAYFEVEITDYDDNITVGDNVTVEFTVENTGDVEGAQEIIFSVNDEEVDTMEITVGAGETESGEFTWDADDEGDHDLEVTSDDYSDSVTVTVEEEPDPGIPGFTTLLLILAAGIAVAIYHKKEQ